jgi:hypothetical protein
MRENVSRGTLSPFGRSSSRATIPTAQPCGSAKSRQTRYCTSSENPFT